MGHGPAFEIIDEAANTITAHLGTRAVGVFAIAP